MGSTTRWRILQAGAEGANASIDLLTAQTSRELVQSLALKHLLVTATEDRFCYSARRNNSLLWCGGAAAWC